jgi:23S rRNA-/tRNA-specific pseudouridylate synthase
MTNCTYIFFISDDILAVNKPYGLEMFGKGHHSLEKYLPRLAKATGVEQLFEVHRIDKTTSGIVLLAKTKLMHKTLVDLFRQRKIDKRYWAIVRGVPEPRQGIINIPLSEMTMADGRYRLTVHPDYRKSKTITNKKNPKRSAVPAVTEYRVLEESAYGCGLLEVKPITGYKHQIRLHLGLGLNCPIVGDHKYTYADTIGKPQKLHGHSLQRLKIRQSQVRQLPILLHAKHVQIPEIVPDKSIWIDAPLTHYFNRFMKAMKMKPGNFVQV